jgi:hypothetical protein
MFCVSISSASFAALAAEEGVIKGVVLQNCRRHDLRAESTKNNSVTMRSGYYTVSIRDLQANLYQIKFPFLSI